MKAFRKNSESGMILIAVLWGVMLLSAIAFALAAASRAGVDQLQNRKESTQGYYLARGAVQRAAVMLATAPTPGNPPLIAQGQQSVEWDDGPNHVVVELEDEAGKIDVNQASEATLEGLLAALDVDLQTASVLGQSIENWRHPNLADDAYGADDSYYLSLPKPYHSPHTDFKSVDELLLVRGITEDHFYGRYVVHDDGQVERKLGLIDCLTVHSGGHSVNINYAPYPVLMALPDMTPTTANYIVSGRATKPFASVSEVTQEFPASLGAETLSYLTAQNGAWFSLIARSTSQSGVSARIRALVKVQGVQNGAVRIVSWDDNYVR
jgi:general secretion pathway protein K